MLGTLGFEQQKIHCVIGIEDIERKQPQDIYIDVKIRIDMYSAINADDFTKTVDYVTLARMCETIAKEGSYRLIETLAGVLLNRLLDHPMILWASVRVSKPGALKLVAQCAFVEVEKEK